MGYNQGVCQYIVTMGYFSVGCMVYVSIVVGYIINHVIQQWDM